MKINIIFYTQVFFTFIVSLHGAVDPRLDERIMDQKFVNKNNSIYFYISEDLAFAGSSGCNNFSGNIKINKQKAKIAFVNVSSTRKYCDDDGAQRAERELFYNFAKAHSYTFKDGVFNILDDKYKILASFRIND